MTVHEFSTFWDVKTMTIIYFDYTPFYINVVNSLKVLYIDVYIQCMGRGCPCMDIETCINNLCCITDLCNMVYILIIICTLFPLTHSSTKIYTT